ncbi:MAG: hypothetical protein IKU52_08285 [Clostridia bacterium]|nr:hypothetical protein [Clostridia bacterium]
MKKLLVLALALVLALSMVACTSDKETANTDTDAPETEAPVVNEVEEETEATVMSYEEFAAAELDSEVTVETYIQAKQGWWTDDQGVSKATFYTQSEDGAYFLYDMPCSEEEYDALSAGTKIKVTGYKAEWSGEVEIIDAKFEILEGEFVASPMDATELLGSDELVDHQNKLVSFTDMTVESIEYKNGEPGDDIYVNLTKDGASYSFCVEVYLTGVDSDVYEAVGELKADDVIDVEGFLYWYEGPNTHITAVTVK